MLAYTLLAANFSDDVHGRDDLPRGRVDRSARSLHDLDVSFYRAGDDDAATALVEGIRQGDEGAFEQMYRSFWPSLTAFARTLIRDADIADEIVSDVFAGVWRRRDAWQPLTVQSYLYGAVRNRALNYRRGLARADAAFALAPVDEPLGTGTADPPVDAALLESERLRAVQRALAALSEPQRTLLVLRWQRQMRWDDIAHVLGISTAAAQQQHSRILKALRAEVEAIVG